MEIDTCLPRRTVRPLTWHPPSLSLYLSLSFFLLKFSLLLFRRVFSLLFLVTVTSHFKFFSFSLSLSFCLIDQSFAMSAFGAVPLHDLQSLLLHKTNS